jgi:parvulin-like peptidyl-prolyl isomerase
MIKTGRYSDNFGKSGGGSGHIFIIGRVLLCLVLSGMIVSCDKFDVSSRPFVATVNDAKIYLDEYQARLDKKIHMVPEEFLNQPGYMEKFEEEVLDLMIVEKIMSLRAKELNISVSNDELENKIREIREDYGEDFAGLFAAGKINYEKWKAGLKEEMILQKLVALDVNAKIKISEDKIEDYFNERRNHYKTDLRARVFQIVVGDMAAAEKAVERLKSGEDFAKVAADVSISPEARRGGDLGFITRWIMPEPLDKTIFSLPLNTISPVVQSPYGFHVFKVTEMQRAREANLADVRKDVTADIRLQKEEAAYRAWLDDLRRKAVITKVSDIKTGKSDKKH